MRIAIVAAALTLTACAQPRSEAGSAACTSGVWREPAVIGGDAHPMLARYPSLAIGAGGQFVAGLRLDLVGAITPSPDWLELRTADGRSIGRPPGDFLFLYPRVIASPVDSSVALVWGEPAAGWTPSGAWYMLVAAVKTLWLSRYDGREWTEPVRLHEGSIDWMPYFVDRILGDARSFTLVAPGELSSGGQLVQIRFDGSRPRSRQITSDVALQPTVERLGERLVVAYLAGAPRVAHDVNSVFVIASDDGGVSWTTPRLISRSGDNPANEVKMRAGSNGALHLVWKQSLDGRMHLRHSMSLDSGRTWSPLESVAAPDGANNLRAATDACGRLHVVFETSTLFVEHVIWEGRWGAPQRLFGGLRAADASLVANPEGGLTLVANVRRPEGDSRTDRTVVVRWR